MNSNAEERRLQDASQQGGPWKKWTPYLSERRQGTVREDAFEMSVGYQRRAANARRLTDRHF